MIDRSDQSTFLRPASTYCRAGWCARQSFSSGTRPCWYACDKGKTPSASCRATDEECRSCDTFYFLRSSWATRKCAVHKRLVEVNNTESGTYGLTPRSKPAMDTPYPQASTVSVLQTPFCDMKRQRCAACADDECSSLGKAIEALIRPAYR